MKRMINLGSNPRAMPWPVDGRLGDPDPEVVDLDHGPVGCRRTWSGAEELAHQYADLRMAA
jgi:hypothetical protein